MSTPRTIVIFYDSPCIDGAASAWVAYCALKDDAAVNMEFVPIGYGKPEERTQKILGHLHDGAEVFFLDTSPKDDTLETLCTQGEHVPKIKSLTVLDHHISEIGRIRRFETRLKTRGTNRNNLPELKFTLNPDKSAAALMTWEYFFPSKPAPKLLEWVGQMEPPVKLLTNRDFAIAAFIDSRDLSTPENVFQSMGSLVEMAEDDIVSRGNSILADQFNNINKGIKTSLLYTFLELLPQKKEWIPIINANIQNFGRRINVAMIEEAFAGTTCGVCGAWFVQGDGTVKLSLRSKGTPDVSKVARHLGRTIGVSGGGHPTDSVVLFETLTQFTQGVTLFTKEHMLNERWNTQPERPEPKEKNGAPKLLP